MNLKRPQAFELDGGKTGVLLIHGFTGTPSEMRPLGEFLAENGFSVKAPLLAGHGTSPEDMIKTGMKDWIQSAGDAYFEFSRTCETVYVAGLSMGGLLALHLAARVPVKGVVSMCAPIFIFDRRAKLARWIAPFKKFSADSAYPDHIEPYMAGYTRTPIRCVPELLGLIRKVKGELHEVQASALILQSEQDKTVKPESAKYIYEHIRSKQKEIRWYPNSGHILPVDHDKEQVFADILAFLQK
ncbi:alpha/beta hydrolase [Effusibacillus dendaii]|uniref:Carboxylesterase n=1 Tax=Effusibacillus dendaii TaxID=2743772 RepID=A0A7I8DDB3_9BACL|nr:alpha/beta fold hydrolase [Effusibacillus dendaii]BCJ86939.1 carboxylesterase [Effusibacillus dendaii]